MCLPVPVMSGMRDIPRLLSLLRECRESQEANHSIFSGPGFGMPYSRHFFMPDEQYVEWRQVEAFLKMAEQALKARDCATEAVQEELQSATSLLLEAKAEQSVVR